MPPRDQSRLPEFGRALPFLVRFACQDCIALGQNAESASHPSSDVWRMSATHSGDTKNADESQLPPGARSCSESATPVTGEQLAALDFFRGIPSEQLKEIARYSKRCRFDAGETLFRQGEIANCFFVVKSGRVLIELNSVGRSVPVQEIGPGEPVGFSWLLNPENLHFTARALEPVETVFFYGTLVREDCEIDHELGYELMRRTSLVMLQRLESLADLLASSLAEKAGAKDRQLPTTGGDAD